MEIGLKDLNRPLLALVLIAHVVAYYILLNSLSLQQAITNLKDYESYSGSLAVAAIVGVLNSLISSTGKARIVFLKWKNPLPGSRAFDEILNQDDRIDPAIITQAAGGTLPLEPSMQNRLWYQWYRQFSDESSVKQVHREFLLTRDWATLTVLLFVGFIPLAVIEVGPQKAGYFALGLIAEFLLVRRSAAVHGNRFVATVLAIKSSEVK